jgi:hypothetical protein
MLFLIKMTFIPSVLSKTDNNNSSTTLLNNNSTFTGVYTETTGFNSILITVLSDQNGSIQLVFSDDGTTSSFFYNYTYYANQQYINKVETIKKYYKIIFTNNSGVNQTSFSLNLRLSTTGVSDLNQTNILHSNNLSVYNEDAFGKLRVSNPYTLLDIKFPSESTGTSEYLTDYLTICNKQTGIATASCQNSKCVMTVSGNGDSYINQSRQYCIYQPGKSLLFLGSGVINGSSNDLTTSSKIGFFDDSNGLFFKYSNHILSINLRNSSLDTTINQSSWNIDKMDGTGLSGLNLDISKCQLFVIDFEWLGVGKIRFGFYANGKINYCHEITNINVLTAPYMVSPNLPIRYEISSTGGQGSLTQICSTVISEGGYNPTGIPFSVNNGISAIPISNVETPILAIKGKTTYNHQNIFPTEISILDTQNNTLILYRIRLFRSPATDPGTFTWNAVNNNSLIVYATSPTGVAFTNSIVIDSGYVYGGKGNILFSNLSNVFNNIFQITSDINNNSDIVMITTQSFGNTTPSVVSSISWQEIHH